MAPLRLRAFWILYRLSAERRLWHSSRNLEGRARRFPSRIRLRSRGDSRVTNPVWQREDTHSLFWRQSEEFHPIARPHKARHQAGAVRYSNSCEQDD